MRRGLLGVVLALAIMLGTGAGAASADSLTGWHGTVVLKVDQPGPFPSPAKDIVHIVNSYVIAANGDATVTSTYYNDEINPSTGACDTVEALISSL